MEALTMGGYGGYVWSAFGFAFLSMGSLLWLSFRAQARRAEELRALRDAVRGGDRSGDGTGERRPRRLVATKPGAAGKATPSATPAATRDVQAGHQGFAPPRPQTGPISGT